jgi:putative membrane protein
MIRKEPDTALEKKLNPIAWAITTVVLLLVSFMHKVHFETGIDFTFLPAVYSGLNAATAVILLVGLYFIKNKQYEKHEKAMTLAMFTSFLFLLGYVLYHITNADTRFLGQDWIRPVYFTLLISHIVLAAVIFPFILFTYIRAFTGQFDRHKKMARWVYWLWLYVAVTGPILYLMIKPYYK